jgi:hypothetical protein
MKLGSSSKLSININTIYFVESIILHLSKGNFTLPYFVLFIILSLEFVPSTNPLLYGNITAFFTASISFSKLFAKDAILLIKY